MAQAGDLPLKAIPARAGLVAEKQPAVLPAARSLLVERGRP
jgi:hypothetical protein